MSSVREDPRTGPAAARPWRRVAAHLGVATLAAIAALAGMGTVSTVVGHVGPGTVAISASADDDGGTTVALPPFGAIVAETHVVPVDLRVRIDSVDVAAIQSILAGRHPDRVVETAVRDDLPDLVARFAVRTLAFAALIGAAVGRIASPRRWWWWSFTGAVGALVGVGGVLVATWLSYDVDAFREPHFSGSLEHAPGIMQAAREHIEGIDGIEDRVAVVSENLSGLYAASQLQPSAADQTLILHVSDIHSNPLGIEFTQKLAENFEVDAVIDTGDITSWGYPVEGRIVDVIAGFDIPYYLVSGNHDSLENRRTIDATDEVELIDDRTVMIDDVEVLGIGDSTWMVDYSADYDRALRIRDARAPEAARQVRAADVDLVAVHDGQLLAELDGGEVDTVISGHYHRRGEERRGDTLFLEVGSTGATGLPSFTVDAEQGYDAQLLRYRGDRLVAVDYITLAGVTGDFEVERRVVTPDPDGEPPSVVAPPVTGDAGTPVDRPQTDRSPGD